MREYLTRTKSALLNESLDGVDDPLLKLGIAEAIRYAAVNQVRHGQKSLATWRFRTLGLALCDKIFADQVQDSAVSVALTIRAASYFSRTRMVMTGPNVLEVPYFEDARLLMNGGLPIPAVLDYQIDYLAIRYMLQCMKQVIGLLKKLIFSQSTRKGWYEIYLTTFVLLSSLEIVHARQIDILRRFEAKVCIPNPQFLLSDVIWGIIEH